MIQQGLMTLGRWDLTFRQDLELEKRRTPDFWDHICITPTRIPDEAISAATVKAQARFTGRIDDIDFGGPRKIGGPSNLVWLGDAQGKGSFQHGGSGGPWNVDVATFLAGLFAAATNVNALTLPTLNTLDAGALGDQIKTYEAARTALMRWMDETATPSEFHCKPNGDLVFQEVGADDIFRTTTPKVLLLERGHGYDGAIYGATANISYTKRIDQYATDVTVRGPNSFTYGASTLFTRPKAFNGSTNAHIEAYAECGSDVQADIEQYAANLLFYNYTPQWDFRVTADIPDPVRWLIPGDYVYLYAPHIDLYDTSKQIVYDGRPLTPVKLRCTGTRWPVTAGMGKYVIKSAGGSNAVYDATDWFEDETGWVTLDIETLPRRMVDLAIRPPVTPPYDSGGA